MTIILVMLHVLRAFVVKCLRLVVEYTLRRSGCRAGSEDASNGNEYTALTVYLLIQTIFYLFILP